MNAHRPSLVLELPAGRDVYCLDCARPWPCPDTGDATVLHADCRDVLAGMHAGSVDAIVTDPPYELGFMGKAWDASGIAYDVDLWREALRVLKPGGHLLAFGGTRTWHRLACAIEDAGFEIRDSIAWLYGSGFPKSLDVSKAIDKAAGAEREVVGTRQVSNAAQGRGLGNGSLIGGSVRAGLIDVTAPATEDAQRWQGWGTALKPAHEPIVVARKPLAGTVAANVLAHGTGALNIDACRIAIGEGDGWDVPNPLTTVQRPGIPGERSVRHETQRSTPDSLGRWPANVTLDEDQAAALDKQSGELGGGFGVRGRGGSIYANGNGYTTTITVSGQQVGYGDTGGASRFFYVAKASTAERPRADGIAHPTVKPLALIRWLVRLVTPPGGLVLDPFAGSGTTVEAALVEGFRVVGVEREADYVRLIEQRLAAPIERTLL